MRVVELAVTTLRRILRVLLQQQKVLIVTLSPTRHPRRIKLGQRLILLALLTAEIRVGLDLTPL